MVGRVGREGKGARPGMLRGGRDAREGTKGGRRGGNLVKVVSCVVQDEKINTFTC